MDDTKKEELVRQLRHKALQFARQQHIRPADQPDFLQECQWQALRKGDDFLESLLNGPDASKTLFWLLRSIEGHFRRSQKTLLSHETPWSALTLRGVNDPEPKWQDRTSFEETVLSWIDLESVLHTLTRNQRNLFVRRYVYEEDCATLARDFHTSEQAIRKRLSTICQKLAAALKRREWMTG